MEASLVLQFTTAIVLGALIGTEREMIQQRLKVNGFGGIRTFMFLGMIGFLSGYIGQWLSIWFVFLTFFLVALLLIASYVYHTFLNNGSGITTELAALLTFMIGGLCYYYTSVAVVVGIVVALILSLKIPLHNFAKKIRDEEFFATIEFALLAFVVLPLLPDRTIDPWGIFNPYEIWLLVLFIVGIGLCRIYSHASYWE